MIVVLAMFGGLLVSITGCEPPCYHSRHSHRRANVTHWHSHKVCRSGGNHTHKVFCDSRGNCRISGVPNV